MIKRPILLSILIGLVFFVLGLITLPHYGINWDTINHLPRGQAYLHYFLTGEKDFSSLPKWQKYWQKADTLSIDTNLPLDQVPTRSIYESDGTTFNWFVSNEKGGHPPLSDILSAGFNQVFFKHLRLVNDIDSYRIYSILLSALLVGLIFWWSNKLYGLVSAVVATLALATYPLFWSELHFNNEKDLPETVYWSFLLFSIWQGVTNKSWKWLLGSGIFFGLALGTKFNVLFIPAIFGPWLMVYLYSYRSDLKQFTRLLPFAVLAIVIGLVIFIGSWPYLWGDIINNLERVVGFYKGIGLGSVADPRFIGPLKTNLYPIFWIITTTPPVTLVLALLGIIFSLVRFRKEKDKVSLLFLLWFLIPIFRVSAPGTNIYGGVRQIMEYIPAMALLAGLGALLIKRWWEKFTLSKKLPALILPVILLGLFIPITQTLIKIHPNENAYFNFLIGGLSGAKEKEIVAWGNTFGAAYRQGVDWINKNAEPNSNVVLAFGITPDIPHLFFRNDLTFQNRNRSGYLRQGEYAISLIIQGSDKRSYYDMYLDRFIEPVYSADVDGVSVLKVWKNDDQHLKSPWNELIDEKSQIEVDSEAITFSLSEPRRLSKLEIIYDEDNCSVLKNGTVQISTNKEVWTTVPGNLPSDWLVSVAGQQPLNGSFIEPFVGQTAQYIKILVSPEDTCLKKIKQYKIYYFPDK